MDERIVLQLAEVFPHNDHKNRNVWRMYLPHVSFILESDLADKGREKRLSLIWRYTNCLYSEGRWNEAETSFIEVEKRLLGVNHPDMLTGMANLASTYRNKDR
jgi:hypothetical protein